jgi:predicted outer membrane repeat protein
VTFNNCTFRDNNCTVAYNEADTLDPADYRYAGGLTLLWRNQPESSVTVLIKNCRFINNTASINPSNDEDVKRRPSFYVPRGHGGAIVVTFNRTSNNKVLIEDTLIINNTARFNGGGIFATFYNKSYENKIAINRTVFEGNGCTNVGGGISMNTFEVADANLLLAEDSRFTGNSAWAGGGACTINVQVW